MATKRTRGWRGFKAFVELWRDLLERTNLLTWASAIAFQVLVALVPLTLLGLGILGALGERKVWEKQLSPGIEKRLAHPVFTAVNYAAEKILTHATPGLLVFALLLAIWEISGSVRAIMGALNRIYDTNEDRSTKRRFAVSFALAIGIGGCLLGAVLAVTLAKRVGGPLHVPISIGRWLVALALMSIAIALLVRIAPAKVRSKGWVSLGSAFIVVAWIVASLIFRWYVTSIASFRSTWGTAVAVLALTGYLYTSAIVFLVGAQADELIRKDQTAGEKGMLARVRAALG